MALEVSVRRLVADDAVAYKRLRDDMLDGFPDAFTSDADTERSKPATAYLPRFAMPGDAARFTLGAWSTDRLVGAISCERDERVKVRHIGHIVGMMVRPQTQGQGVGRALLKACIAHACTLPEIELLTLSVTSSNASAIALYEKSGFTRYGQLPQAIKVGGEYLGKDLMMMPLR